MIKPIPYFLELLCAPLLACQIFAGSMQKEIEADWLRQAEAWRPRSTATQADAPGAVDGIKNGKYGFHTAQEPNPWWQVDLGKARPVARVVVFNRLDYAPGLHNADHMRVWFSDDGSAWRQVYDTQGKFFGGVAKAPPLEVRPADGTNTTRFVRLQVRSAKPVFFHLDEVEVYGSEDPRKNLALNCPADQSSACEWSTVKPTPSAPKQTVTREIVSHFIERGRLLAKELKRNGVDTASAGREFAAVALALGDSQRLSPDEIARLYLQVRWNFRRLAFRHPVLNFKRLLMVKRFCQETYPDVCLNHMPWVSRPGGDLCVLTLNGPENAPEVRPLLNGRLGSGHVHGVDLSWDGKKIVFGFAKSKSAQPPSGWLDRTQSYRLRREEEPIHIYEMGVDKRKPRQLTRGEWSDLDPTYAPNGDIVFVSERCGTSLQCNEYDKDETSCNLYTMRPNGTGIRRLSANKDGDYLPHTLDDGMIGYTRWEYHERSWAFIQSLWTLRPDGTQADAIFKQHFVNPWALEDVRSIPGTRNTRLVCIAAGHHTLPAGPVAIVTPGVGINEPRGIGIVTPGVLPPEGGMDGVPVSEGGVHDRGGYYMHPWPLSEKTFLVSYSYGAGKTGLTSEIDPTGYALYLIDVFGTKELLYRDPSISCFHPIPLRARPRPPVLPNLVVSGSLYATCTVSLVSQGSDGIAPERARYLRVAEPIGWPYDNRLGGQRYGEDHRYGGPGAERKNLTSWTPMRILGDVPVEADGSASFRVPADTAVYFQILDDNRRELRRMRSFVSFQPGEQRSCVGCHESRAAAPASSPHSVSLAMRREPSVPLPPPWGDRPLSFLRDIQPVFDRRCVSCHCGLKPAAGLDFYGGLTSCDSEVAGYGHNRAFETILEKGLVAMSAVRAQDASITPPFAYGALKSKLMTCLTDTAHRDRITLTDDERLRLNMWIDANAPYHDRFVNKRPERPAYDLAADQGLRKNLAALHARRCGACHRSEDVTRLDWIDIHDPARSLFLTAPLAVNAGGRAKCAQVVFKDATDADYRAIRDLVAAAVRQAWQRPRRDLISLQKD